MIPDWIIITLVVITLVGFFTDFYGLGTKFQNRGHWYNLIGDEELTTVLDTLFKLNIHKNSDGLISEYVKIQGHVMDNQGTRLYRVKVPNWIFKDVQVKLTHEQKLRTLGLTPPD